MHPLAALRTQLRTEMTFLLGSTRVESTVTLDAVSGRFLQSNEETIILGRPSQIDVFRESEPAYLTSIFTQPTFDRLLSLTKIPGRPFTEEADELQVSSIHIGGQPRSVAHSVLADFHVLYH